MDSSAWELSTLARGGGGEERQGRGRRLAFRAIQEVATAALVARVVSRSGVDVTFPPPPPARLGAASDHRYAPAQERLLQLAAITQEVQRSEGFSCQKF